MSQQVVDFFQSNASINSAEPSSTFKKIV